MARKKQSGGDDGPRGDEWLGTYSDCVTLLMTFFVLLYSMSSVDAQKVQAISQAFSVLSGQSADSILQYDMYDGSEPIIGGESKEESEEEQEENSEQNQGAANKTMYEKVKEYLAQSDLDGTVEVTQNDKGISLELRDNVLFESGKANLISGSNTVLDKINALISTLPNSVVIEGHTDNIPISNSEYKDNWDLSSARASNVLRYFTTTKHQDPTRFSCVGYGEYKPKVENTSDENRAQNRRVNILIVSSNNGSGN